jgi:hypothetical protein
MLVFVSAPLDNRWFLWRFEFRRSLLSRDIKEWGKLFEGFRGDISGAGVFVVESMVSCDTSLSTNLLDLSVGSFHPRLGCRFGHNLRGLE